MSIPTYRRRRPPPPLQRCTHQYHKPLCWSMVVAKGISEACLAQVAALESVVD